MKLILSRKGFDAATGGVASPIFDDGRLCSLPIPEKTGHPQGFLSYDAEGTLRARIWFEERSLGILVQDLTGGKIPATAAVHLDPDLKADSLPRLEGWKPLFGQGGAAERHLQKQGVGAGDIFLFFGWFRQVEQVNGQYRYCKGSPDLHVIFGWLQVERRIELNCTGELHRWMDYHPHCQRNYHAFNSLYVATDQLCLPNISRCCPGGGVFNDFAPALCLTASGQSKGQWQLPAWFAPHGKNTCLSYHGDLKRWTSQPDAVHLRTVGRGQEFVLDTQEYPEAPFWLDRLFSNLQG
jgi:hypothetical protein